MKTSFLFYRAKASNLLCVITLFFVTIVLSLPSQCQDVVRSWQSASGNHSTYGELVEKDNESITIKNDKGKLLKVPLSKLSETDQRLIAGIDIIKRDREQFDLVQPHLQRYQESPVAVGEILEEIHRQHPESPYAAMMVGVAYASEEANYKKATRFFEDAKDSIEDAQKKIGKGYHFQTLMTINNNLALCALKERKGNEAARYLLAAVDSEEIPFVVYHNATILMEVTKGGGAIRFNDKNRRKLVGMVARKAPKSPGVPVPKRYMYALAWDNPISIQNLEQLAANPDEALAMAEAKSTNISGAVFQSEKQLKDRGYKEMYAGSGFLIAPDLLLTNRHVVQSKTNDLSYTLTQYTEDGQPSLVGGSIVKWSILKEQDLALIKLDKPITNVDPLPIRRTELEEGDEITALGFPQVFQQGEHIQATGGKFVGYDEEQPWHYSSIDVDQGNSGGPCLDSFGNVCGIVFAKQSRSRLVWIGDWVRRVQIKSSGVSVSNKAIQEFLDVARPNFIWEAEKTETLPNRQQLAESARGSILLVKSWIPPSTLVEENVPDHMIAGKNKMAEVATLREKLLWPDLWCMNCTNGWESCGCNNGQVFHRKERYKSGKNPINGATIYGYRDVYKKCSDCKGKGGRKCRFCNGGKMPLHDE
jgi:S1-C subfamily serine protease